MIDVVTMGECMALVYPMEPVRLEDSRSLRLDMAGAESNLCIGLSRLGHTARFISRVGQDSFGRLIRRTLEQEGVDTSFLIDDPVAPTGVFFREHLPDGERRVSYYRNRSAASLLSPEDLDPVAFAGARIVHLTGITPALSESCAAACHKAIQLAREAGASISFDPNFRPRLWTAAEAREALRPFITGADIVLMGHEDVQAVIGEVLPDDALLQFAASFGPEIVVLKRAERGACALAGGCKFEVPPFPAESVVDPVGAGDGFDAGFLAGWLRGWSMEESLALGAKVGAAAVSVMGDYEGYPRLSRRASGGAKV